MRVRFTLRTLLVMITVAAVAIAMCSYRVRVQRKRLDAMTQIESAGGHVGYRRNDGSVPHPVDDRVRRTVAVDRIYLAGTELNDKILRSIEILGEVRMLSFNSTSFSDGHLRYLDPLENLRELQLNGTRITDLGVERLSRTHDLQLLTLNITNIRDRALDHLAGISTLRKLHLHDTPLSNEAVATLRRALPSCEIEHTPLGRRAESPLVGSVSNSHPAAGVE